MPQPQATAIAPSRARNGTITMMYSRVCSTMPLRSSVIGFGLRGGADTAVIGPPGWDAGRRALGCRPDVGEVLPWLRHRNLRIRNFRLPHPGRSRYERGQAGAGLGSVQVPWGMG